MMFLVFCNFLKFKITHCVLASSSLRFRATMDLSKEIIQNVTFEYEKMSKRKDIYYGSNIFLSSTYKEMPIFLGMIMQRTAGALCVIFMILVSLENVKTIVYRVVAQLPQRLKSTYF